MLWSHYVFQLIRPSAGIYLQKLKKCIQVEVKTLYLRLRLFILEYLSMPVSLTVILIAVDKTIHVLEMVQEQLSIDFGYALNMCFMLILQEWKGILMEK